MRIAVLYDADIVNSYYRAVLPLREMERRGHEVLWPSHASVNAPPAEIPPCDVVHIHRLAGPPYLDIVRHLRARGTAVVWDNDDDLAELPRISRAYRRAVGRRGRKGAARYSIDMARAATVVSVPCDELATRYRAYGVETVEVIENHLADADVRGRRTRHDGVVIGMTLGWEHQVDLDHVRLDRVVSELLQRYGGDVRFKTIGLSLGLEHTRIEHVAHVPIDRLVAAERGIDIGLAPLQDSPFNRARSNVKLKEYAAAGATWLASPVGPYLGMGDQHGGSLAETGAWLSELTTLIEQPRLRARRIEAARSWARSQSIGQAGRAWETTYRRALERQTSVTYASTVD